MKTLTRREFLRSLGDSCLIYAFCFVPGIGKPQIYYESQPEDIEEIECRAADLEVEYRESIVFDGNGNVSLFCGRTELGQGLATVLTALVTQGLEISREQLTVILGDTDLCPDHGPTVGSAATEQVAWGIWNACLEIRKDLVRQAAKALNLHEKNLIYHQGGVRLKNNPKKIFKPQEISGSNVVFMKLDPKASTTEENGYKDIGITNVNAVAIVTGTRKYAGDLNIPGAIYADWDISPYHPGQTRLKSADLSEALSTPGIERAEVVRGRVVVAGKRYQDVVKGLSKVKTEWYIPNRPKGLRVEEEIRAGANLERIIEQKGDVESGLAASYKVISETYRTHYTSWAQIETDTALAKMEHGGNRVSVWAGSQWPHHGQRLTADLMNLPESSVHINNTPVGGCFGGKVGQPVLREAAELSRRFATPVKLVYSRKNQFQKRSTYKTACILDLTTGVGTDGRILARKIDIYQDLGEGTRETYYSPNSLIRHFKTDMPFRQGNSRGTSYVQIRFAVESHMDMVAEAVGWDPFKFRVLNVELRSFIPMISTCSAMIGYPQSGNLPDEGIGMGICNHGSRQMGAVAAHVKVDRVTGKVHVLRICAAFDIGTVINRHTATACLRGGIIMGLGYVLKEEVKLDGHGCYTEYLGDYGIPRFSDVCPIDIKFLNTQAPGAPRGCGELPVIPAVSAIANAVYNAIGIRFYKTPITPERVLNALGTA